MIREFQLDEWRARPELHQLVGPSGSVTVEARSMEVLVALAESVGEVVSREELLDRVWGELFVSEEVLSHAIWDLRRALGDDPKSPRLIHTHRKQGYRLVAKISWLDQGVGDTGRYRLLERIGSGAMGIVFKGEDTRLARTVALKFLPPEWSRDELAKARFLREAKTAAALDHPNLCTLLEIDETDDGRLFLVMPFYQGETLRTALDRGPLDPDRVLAVGLQVASGLAALHREGIVHRDIKPGNILLAEDGEAKILDFGLAKFAGSTRLTRIGSSPGTPAYMAPEQVRGEEAEPASDVWSLGAMLYEALSGRPPFGSGNEEATFYSIVHSDPEPLPASAATVGLSRVLAKALAKSCTERYGDAEEMRVDLRRLTSAGNARDPVSDFQQRVARLFGTPGRRLRQPAAVPAGPRGIVGDGGPPRPATATVGKRLRRAAPWVGGALILALLATAGLLWRERRGEEHPAEIEVPSAREPERVVVLPFENRTGDPDLDGIGLMAADLVGNGLAQTGRLAVVPPGEAEKAVRAASRDGRTVQDLPGAVGLATDAQLAVSGSYYLADDELRFRADALDLTAGDLLRSLEPVTADRRHPQEAVEELRERLMSVVSMRVDLPHLKPALFSHIPRYEVYQEFWVGYSVSSIADADTAREHLIRAYELDPDFLLAGLYLAGAPLDLIGHRHREPGLLELDARRHRLTPFERHLADALLNQTRGRWADALLLLRKAERLAPESPWINTQISKTALWLNRPREALEVMEKIPVEEIRSPFALWRRIVNRGYALHSLGRYEEELEFARRARELLPNLPTEPTYAEVRALAAMARLDELDRAIESSMAEVTPMFSGNPSWYLLASALQLRAHGHPVKAREYAERAVASMEKSDVPNSDPRVYGWALWLLGRYDEAHESHARLLAERPDRIILRGELACLAALRGDREEALEHAAQIAANSKPYVYGAREIFRGLIHAHLGDLDRAVELLAEGFAAGDSYEEFRVHYHVFLNPLLGYPPYEELVRPKGPARARSLSPGRSDR